MTPDYIVRHEAHLVLDRDVVIRVIFPGFLYLAVRLRDPQRPFHGSNLLYQQLEHRHPAPDNEIVYFQNPSSQFQGDLPAGTQRPGDEIFTLDEPVYDSAC